MSDPIFPKLALIGIGLIGGSIALAARRGELVGHVAISTRTPETPSWRGERCACVRRVTARTRAKSSRGLNGLGR